MRDSRKGCMSEKNTMRRSKKGLIALARQKRGWPERYHQ
jgi:hypothetical protein